MHSWPNRHALRSRVAFGSGLEIRGPDLAHVGGILELVDGGPYLAKVPPELRFALALHGHPRERHHGRRQDDEQCRNHEQFDKCESAPAREDVRTSHVARRTPHVVRFHLTVTVTGLN